MTPSELKVAQDKIGRAEVLSKRIAVAQKVSALRDFSVSCWTKDDGGIHLDGFPLGLFRPAMADYVRAMELELAGIIK